MAEFARGLLTRVVVAMVLVMHSAAQSGPRFVKYGSPGCTGTEDEIFHFRNAVSEFTECNALGIAGSEWMKVQCEASEIVFKKYTDGGCTTGEEEKGRFSMGQAGNLFSGGCGDSTTMTYYKFDNSPGAGACGISAGGDPVTTFRGVEYKFLLPLGQLTTLLKTKDLILKASAFAGEAADEQWMDRMVVESAAGEQVVDISVRRDIATFDRSKEVPGTLESVEVRVPWMSDKLLTWPSSDDRIVQGRGWALSGYEYAHPHNIVFDLFRVDNPHPVTYNFDASKPHREGVMIMSDSVKIMIVSTSALEYYYLDADDQRAMKYAHLDIEIIDMVNESSFTGMLPEVWGIAAKTNKTEKMQISTDETANSADPASNTSQLHRQTLKRHILEHLLEPRDTAVKDNTAASVCSGLQCSQSSARYFNV